MNGSQLRRRGARLVAAGKTLGGPNSGRLAFIGVMGAVQAGFLAYRYLLAVTVGAGTFGSVDAIIVTATLASSVGSLGMAAAVSHFASKHRSDPNAAALRIVTATTVNLVSMMVLAAAVLTWLALSEADTTVQGFGRQELFGIVIIATLASLALSVTNALVSMERFGDSAVGNMVRVACLLASIGLFSTVATPVSVLTVAISIALAWGLQLIWGAARTRSLLPRVRPSFAVVREVVPFGMTALLHATGTWTLLALDRVLLKQRVEPEELGRYSYAYLFALSYTQIYLLANQAWRTAVYRFLSDGPIDGPTARNFFRPARNVIVVVTGISMVLVPLISEVLAPAEFKGTDEIVVVLTVAAYWLGQYITTVNVVFFHSRLIALSAVSLVSGAFTGVPIVLFVEEHGVIVAAWSTAAGYLALFVFSTVIAIRLCRLPVGFIGAVLPGAWLTVAAVWYVSSSSWSAVGSGAIALAVAAHRAYDLRGYLSRRRQ